MEDVPLFLAFLLLKFFLLTGVLTQPKCLAVSPNLIWWLLVALWSLEDPLAKLLLWANTTLKAPESWRQAVEKVSNAQGCLENSSGLTWEAKGGVAQKIKNAERCGECEPVFGHRQPRPRPLDLAKPGAPALAAPLLVSAPELFETAGCVVAAAAAGAPQ